MENKIINFKIIETGNQIAQMLNRSEGVDLGCIGIDDDSIIKITQKEFQNIEDSMHVWDAHISEGRNAVINEFDDFIDYLKDKKLLLAGAILEYRTGKYQFPIMMLRAMTHDTYVTQSFILN
ncbi:hypothetical protein [uncultured Draconibacterium sp.]|uniref:hypothetical protein n=1 Tax=uncultured Draconibacterium sp. TaxID=1573823 RepID=UPI002AA6833F|nr:hypothetical protein [uncultured Draconibacterium sp.]